MGRGGGSTRCADPCAVAAGKTHYTSGTPGKAPFIGLTVSGGRVTKVNWVLLEDCGQILNGPTHLNARIKRNGRFSGSVTYSIPGKPGRLERRHAHLGPNQRGDGDGDDRRLLVGAVPIELRGQAQVSRGQSRAGTATPSTADAGVRLAAPARSRSSRTGASRSTGSRARARSCASPSTTAAPC